MYTMSPGAVPMASVGAFAIQAWLGADAFPYVLLFMSACYWVTAPVVYRRAKKTSGV